MTPVVNGLEESYAEKIDFRWYDANSTDGNLAFRYYRLVGHPSYVILNPDAQVLWSGLGEQSASALSQQIEAALGTP